MAELLIASGNEITDALRALSVQGDARGAGTFPVTNLEKNGGFESNTTYYEDLTPVYGGVVAWTRPSDSKFGTKSLKITVSTVAPSVGDTASYSACADGIGNAVLAGDPVHVVSAWMKAPAGKSVYIRAIRSTTNDNTGASFGARDYMTTVVADGSWQKVTTVVPASPAWGTVSIVLRIGLRATGVVVGDWVQIDGVQVEKGSVAHDYVETNGATATATQTRLPAADSSFGIHEATTNLAYKAAAGDPFATSGFVSGTGVTKTAVGNGWYDLFGGTGATASFRVYALLADLVNAQVYASSFFSDDAFDAPESMIWCDGGTMVSQALGNGVTRRSVISSRATYDASYRFFDIRVAANTTVRVKWAQIERKPLVTPYSASVSARPVARVQAPASLLNTTQGWVAIRARMGFPSSASPDYLPGFWSWMKSDNTNYIWLHANVGSVGFGKNASAVYQGASWAVGDTITVIGKWFPTGFGVSFNGGPFTLTASGGPDTGAYQTTFDIGDFPFYTRSIDSDVLWFACGKGDLSNADAAVINGFASIDKYPFDFPGANSAVWHANTSEYYKGVQLVILPAETAYGDIERDLIDNEPPGLFPDGQDSLWGQMRKTYADYLQVNIADDLAQWYTNLDPRVTDVGDLPEWEYRVGVPYAPTNQTLEQRRQFVLSRLYRGVFTRTKRKQIIESFISSTYGPSLGFDAGGLALDAGGLALYSGAGGPVSTQYRVYEDVRNYTYQVRILNTLGTDMLGMRRELRRITPGGINSTAMTAEIIEVAQILEYAAMMIDSSPVGYWKMAALSDSSGYGSTLTANGGATIGNLASPGLLNAAVSGVTAATDLDGTDDYFSAAHAAHMNVGDTFSLEAWVRPDVLQLGTILSKGTNGFHLRMTAAGLVELVKEGGAVIVASTVALVAATAYHIVATKNGAVVKLWINAVDRTGVVTNLTIADTASILAIGRRSASATEFFNGVIDEVALYQRDLSSAEVLAHYNTGINIP